VKILSKRVGRAIQCDNANIKQVGNVVFCHVFRRVPGNLK
jgi:hypothetical protein